MDIVDIANRDTDLQLQKRLDAARGNVPVPGNGHADCQECSEAVDAGRRNLGYSICFDCAEKNERKAGFGR